MTPSIVEVFMLEEHWEMRIHCGRAGRGWILHNHASQAWSCRSEHIFTMPSPSPLGAPERNQTLVAFSGGFRPIRLGLKSAIPTFRSMHHGVYVCGGIQAQAILRPFGGARTDRKREADDEDENMKKGWRAFTREPKFAGVVYSAFFIPHDGRKGGQQI